MNEKQLVNEQAWKEFLVILPHVSTSERREAVAREIRSKMGPCPEQLKDELAAALGEDQGEAVTLSLVLKFHWYDETEAGRKRIEYRERSDRWKRLIWDRRDRITYVRFFRGMSKRSITYKVDRIDIGPCPIEGWNDHYFRIHFSDECEN